MFAVRRKLDENFTAVFFAIATADRAMFYQTVDQFDGAVMPEAKP